jgi:hypothetical protein
LDGAGQSLRQILNKVKLWHFHITSNEVMWPKIFSNYMQGLESAILAIFQKRPLVHSSRIRPRISKILFALGADEFLKMLEGKIRVTTFFKIQSGKITV